MQGLLHTDTRPPVASNGSQTANTHAVLVAHFFARFFDKESLSPQGDPEASLAQLLGILATPSAFFVLLFRPFGMTNWSLVTLRHLFVSLSMLVMGFILVFEWDALFPDRRDYQILTPLPLRRFEMFTAKVLALALLMSLFLVDVNLFGTLLWPGIESGGGLVSDWATHIFVVGAAGLFMALFVAVLRGVLVLLFRGWLLRRLSVIVQTLLMSVLVTLLMLTPIIGMFTRQLVTSHHWILYCLPSVWFTALYEWIHPATTNRAFLEMGPVALQALGAVIVLFLLTYLPAYHLQINRVVEAPEPSPRGPSLIRRALDNLLNRIVLCNAVERAVFHFISETITRSAKHRLFLAMYGGLGAALAFFHFSTGRNGKRELPLVLSFILVSGLRAAFNFPSELSANWPFQMTDSQIARSCLQAIRKWVALCAIAPLFLLMAVMEFHYFPWRQAISHLAYGLTLSIVMLELLFLSYRKVPFTCSFYPGKVNLVGLMVIYVLGFTAYSDWMARLEVWMYSSALATSIFYASAAAILVLLGIWRRFLLEETTAVDYEDVDESSIRTLGLEIR
ncbi:hypothetical protein [uncultured Paludibaculum sp.]|uniref:hypothetical protein n=1 Tax=uncultured Paludibaculum sp. TaxID=1765020 RepID=UPI002AAB1A69|nr:hypothetical protein [uncultured Paludibaculum sp.]